MGTIPAPNIADAGGEIVSSSLQVPNQLAEFARVAGLQQQTRQAAAMAPLQQEEAQQRIEAQRRQFADQDALTKTLTEFDPDKHQLSDIPKIFAKNGGSGQGAIAATNHLIDQRKSYNALSQEDFDKQQHIADLTAGVHDTVSEAPAEQKQQLYTQGLQNLARAGADVSKEPQIYPGDDEFAKHLPAIRLHSAIIAESAKDRELSNKEQEESNKEWKDFPTLGVALNTQTGETKNVAGAAGVMSPQMMEGKYVALLQKQNSGQPLQKDDAAFVKSYEHMKSLVPIANFNLQNSGAAADAGGNPSQIAQAIASNRMKWTEAVSPRTPQSVKNSIMSQVFKLNPNYDTSEFGLETDAAKKARSGAWADTRVAYNTAIDHADQLLKAADALGNGDQKTLNSLKNVFKTQFGSPDVTNFDAIANAYNHEVTSVVSKGHITDAEVAAGHATLPDNASPDQIKGVAAAYKNLMSSKRDELDKVIKAGAGNKADTTLGVKAGAGGATHKVGDVVVQNGHRYKATAVDKDGKVTAADPL